MAKLFLSYSRKDEAKARRFTGWLERGGHDVWRDKENIGGGASFSSEIENALTECDAVLVLWSADSIGSSWVRDEAGFGRDAGKLLPFSLDLSQPPIGFRQFQSIDLSKWKSGDPPGGDRILQSIKRITGRAPPAAAHRTAASHRWTKQLFKRPLLIGVAMAVAAGGAAIFLWQPFSNNAEIAIAVLPSPQSPDRAMAADYANVAAADMAAFLPRRFDRATVLAPADANGQNAGYRMLISADPSGSGTTASLTLSDANDHATLWSQNWSVTHASAADLKAEVSETASKAARCLMDARSGSSRISQPALGLYLSGCTGLGGTTLSNADFVTIFERVTRLAPHFGPGWDYLALCRSWIAEALEGSSPAHASAVQSARDAIAAARKLNPNSAMSYDAEYHLISNDTFLSLQILEKGARIDPDDGRIQMHLSDELMSVGRMSDSVQAAARGVELEPSTPYTRSQYILSLVYSGQFSKANADIAEARRKWPNDPVIDNTDFSIQLRYGDPRGAATLLPRVADSDAEMVPYQKLIAARLDPTPAKIDDAIAAFKARWSNDISTRNKVLSVLGTFRKVDEIYQMLEDPAFQRVVGRGILFRPDFAVVRADRRFMQIAARLGLVRYWQQTDYWPDFCTSERLPYDCKAEATKYPH